MKNLKRYEDPISCYEEVLKLDPNDTAAWNSKGVSHYNLDRYDEALKCYDSAIALDPQYHPALNNKKRLIEQQEKTEKEIEEIEKAQMAIPGKKEHRRESSKSFMKEAEGYIILLQF